MKTIALCTLSLILLAACDDKNKATKDVPVSSATPSSSIASPLPPTSGAPVASGKPADAKAGASWGGTYSLAPGALSIPTDNKDYNGVKQFKDDPSKLMGDGKIDLTVDAAGKVAGTVEGAAGPAIIDGSVVGEEIRGTVRRKEPKDDGLTGTLTAKIAGDSAEGMLKLSEANAAIVRESKIVLKKK